MMIAVPAAPPSPPSPPASNALFVTQRSRRETVAVIGWSVVRVVVSSAILVGLYYLLPFDGLGGAGPLIRLLVGLGAFVALVVWQTRTIIRSPHPGLRAIEALAVTIPLLVLTFAATYYVMERANANAFTEPLTRTDSLYFAVTVMTTTGFGDIAARTQEARVFVTIQMALDLVVLGLGLRVILGAVKIGRARAGGSSSAS
jgi:preprotein translocase subunit YajC